MNRSGYVMRSDFPENYAQEICSRASGSTDPPLRITRQEEDLILFQRTHFENDEDLVVHLRRAYLRFREAHGCHTPQPPPSAWLVEA